MTVETATYISDLNASNPPAADGLVEGDDHLRLIKSAIKASFPSIAGAATVTHTVLNNLGSGIVSHAAGSSGAPPINFGVAGEGTLGLYRSSAGTCPQRVACCGAT
jgi:hypothetical protein